MIIRSVSYHKQYWVYRIGYCCIGENLILHASLRVRQLLTGRITQDDHRALAPCHPQRTNTIWSSTRPQYGRGWGVGWGKTVTLYQPPRDTKTMQYRVLAPPPAGNDDDSLNCQSH